MILHHRISWIVFIMFLGCNNKSSTKAESSEQPSIQLSEIKLSDLNGHSFNPEQYRGKAIFINFWATWCRPCLEELPSIQKAMELIPKDKIIFLFASNEAVEQIDQFKKNNDYNFNYVRAENIEELNIMALPTTFIFNPEGKLIFSEMGYRQWDKKENLGLISKNIY